MPQLLLFKHNPHTHDTQNMGQKEGKEKHYWTEPCPLPLIHTLGTALHFIDESSWCQFNNWFLSASPLITSPGMSRKERERREDEWKGCSSLPEKEMEARILGSFPREKGWYLIIEPMIAHSNDPSLLLPEEQHTSLGSSKHTLHSVRRCIFSITVPSFCLPLILLIFNQTVAAESSEDLQKTFFPSSHHVTVCASPSTITSLSHSGTRERESLQLMFFGCRLMLVVAWSSGTEFCYKECAVLWIPLRMRAIREPYV